MSFWDGTRWVEGATAPSSTTSRRANSAATIVMILALVALLVPFAATSAHTRYPWTLSASPSTLHAGDLFSVSVCGYDTALVNVVIGFTVGSWGSALDAGGCFTIADIPALSGDTLAPGVYPVNAFQYVHRKWTETGETTVTIVP